MKGYVASPRPSYKYPVLGDPKPPGGADVQLLTVGGIAVRGKWNDSGHFLAWAELPARDKEKEARAAALGIQGFSI